MQVVACQDPSTLLTLCRACPHCVQVVLAIGCGIGLVSGLLVCGLLLGFPHALTRDATLWPSMASVVVPVSPSGHSVCMCGHVGEGAARY